MTGTDREFEHAWRHFQVHAAQRMSVFNFFVGSAGLLLSGLAYVLQGRDRPWTLGVAAGLLLALLSFLFWKLDQRTAELAKASEAVLAEIERAQVAAGRRIFEPDEALCRKRTGWSLRTPWTYGRTFRVLFWVLGGLGLAGAVAILVLRFATVEAKPLVTASTMAPRAPASATATGAGRKDRARVLHAPAAQPPASGPKQAGAGVPGARTR